MNTDRDLQDEATRRNRGRRLAWLAAGAALAGTLMALGPTTATDSSRAGLRLLEQSAPVVPQHMASLSADINWDTIEPAADPSPLAVAAYEH